MIKKIDKHKYDEKFDDCIDELKKLYEVDPQIAVDEVKIFNSKLRNRVFQIETRKNILILIILSAIILLESLLTLISNDSEFILLYFAGFIFFIAGHFIAMNVKGFGLIFLFSHSILGMSLMISPLVGLRLDSPIMTDLPLTAHYYLGVTLFMLVTATVYVIAFNLNDRLKKLGILDIYH